MCKTLDGINGKVDIMQKEIECVQKDMDAMKTDVKVLQNSVTAINTKIDIVVRYFTGWRAWAIFLIFLASVALAGQRLIEIITRTPIQ